MKPEIHPDYREATYICACGEAFVNGTTRKQDVVRIEICNKCHPFFTGKQKMVDASGRVDRFKKRVEKAGSK
ncbi:MAG: 50S ribosomal protein L31 [Firmicutes bacterium]|nr:50S ribosomal protein L31 [Bacillota bacterium]